MAINIFNFSVLQADELEGPFNEWIVHIKQLAKEKGISDKTLASAFKDIERNERVIELDRKQPEFKLNFNQYLLLNSMILKGIGFLGNVFSNSCRIFLIAVDASIAFAPSLSEISKVTASSPFTLA